LDPEGVLWVRNLTKYLASQGRTIFLSSHLMSEMALTADHLIVVGRGHVLADAPVSDVIARAKGSKVRVRSPRANDLEELLQRGGASVTTIEPGVLDVFGRTAEEVGDAAASAGLPLHELTPVGSSLEDAYLQLTADEVEYHSTPVGTSTDNGAQPATQGASR
jgi:ABC-2 type transport system ATP-binding protein